MTGLDPESGRRSRPRIIDADWLVLRGLSRAIADYAKALAGPGLSALDFGCGSQAYRGTFEALGTTYRGADFGSGADCSISGAGIVDAPDSSADLVLSFQVLEHVRDLDTYFSEAKRLLRPGGGLLLSTHGTWLYHPHPEDHRRWTRQGLISEIETRGWKVEDCQPIVGPLAWTTILRLTGFCFALRRIPVLGRPAAAILAVVMNARAVVEDWVTPRGITQDNACVYIVHATLRADAT